MTLSKEIRLSPLAIADAYKESHAEQYPSGTTFVYSNLTPRRGRDVRLPEFVFFGLQAFLLKLNDRFQKDFFDLSEKEAVNDFATFYRGFFGADNDKLTERVRALHRLGYLPLRVWALAEGSIVPHGVPVLTIQNTHPEFFWLTNFVETWMSAELWHVSTSATTAHYYRKMFDKYAEETTTDMGFVDFQGHDFSMRGLPGIEAGMASGAGHLLSFKGTDTCPALHYIEKYYPGSSDLIGTSVPATEHSVMCAGSEAGEYETFHHLLTEVYPKGILSVVSDTWDFWNVVENILPQLKDIIMVREGKLVIRPDSSPKTPAEIILGDPYAQAGSAEYKGLIRCLYETFGGTMNSKGYIELDPHVGAIYGDSITLELQETILKGLKFLGFASTNIVLGIGSYTYQYVTRDTHGIAVKATVVGSGWGDTFVPKAIFKDPKTDNSGKKSAKGFLNVSRMAGVFCLKDDCCESEMHSNSWMRVVYEDGVLPSPVTFNQVRETLRSQDVR